MIRKYVLPILAVIGVAVRFKPAAKLAMLPVPLPRRPTDGLSLVQLNVTPAVAMLDPNVIAGIVPPEQTTMFVTALTIGVGLIVIVNVF